MEIPGFQHTAELQALMGKGHELANYLDSEGVKTGGVDVKAERGITDFKRGEETGWSFVWYFVYCEGGTVVSLNFRDSRISNVTISEGSGGKDAVAQDVKRLLGN